ncbi:MAG: RNase adapter RapZ [Clostridiales bacterium]|nr:RNase adapter RapZ [Clostridiales bacterium]
MRFVIITGISGAGKSLAMKHMEDMGFFCVDNLPPALMSKFIEICVRGESQFSKIALVMDIRGGSMLDDLLPCLKVLKKEGIHYEILFLDASDDTLIKRYKETRRIHPLSANGMLIEGIQEERRRLCSIRNKADNIIDTSNLSSKTLKNKINAMFVNEGEEDRIITNIVSFGFKYGVPAECDLVFDVRFIPNPYYIDELKNLSGKDEKVQEFVFNINTTRIFVEKIVDMLEFLLPNYKKEGKLQVIIGIGCTGGRHRSVAISEKIYDILKSKKERVLIDHRDIYKDNRYRG